MVCRDFILPEPASYVFFYAIFNLRNLLYIISGKRKLYGFLRNFKPVCLNMYPQQPQCASNNL